MFSQRIDRILKFSILGGVGTLGIGALVLYFGMRNDVSDVGYRPQQPVPFSHKLHVGELQIHCQYCHAGVEQSEHSPIPTTSTCMGCHIVIKAESPKLALVRESWENGTPIQWRRVHKLPDYVHFNHSRHIRAQIDCQSCHGNVEVQGVIAQNKPLSMGWCLDCHRNPEKHIIPARPISGIFTGEKLPENFREHLFEPIKSDLAHGVAARVRPITAPQFGAWETDIPMPQVAGIPHPKLPGFGPENCSACHY